MTSIDITLLITDSLLLASFVVFRALQLAPEPVSAFELKRRVAAGDNRLEGHYAVLPRLIALRNLLVILVSVSIVIVAVTGLGWLIGGLASVGLFIIAEKVSGQTWLKDTVTRHYKVYEPQLVALITKWNWLGMFTTPTAAPDFITVASKPELIDLIDRTHTVLTHDEKQHLQSALAFNDVTVEDVMTPRSMIDSIDLRESIGPLVLDQLHKTGHSRFPVIDGDVDHVVGMLYLHDLVTLNSTHKTAKGAMQPDVYYVRQDHNLERALHAFLRTHHHLFIVVNEFRETVGLLSLEDVVESLLGREVVDEFDEYHDLRKVAETNPRKSNEPKGRIDI